MLVDFVFHRSLALDEAAARARRSRAARRSGFPDADRALPGGRPADSRPGRDRLGAAAWASSSSCWWTTSVAASPWEQDLYRMAVPPEIEIRFATVRGGRRRSSAAWQAGTRRGAAPHRRHRHDGGAPPGDPVVVHRINLGGMHHRPGRRERLPYLYLTDEELRGARRAGGGRRRGHRAGLAHRAAGARSGRSHDRRSHRTTVAAARPWGTLVALDLVSVPQAMIARPLVAGAVAGWLVGDVEAGLRVGVAARAVRAGRAAGRRRRAIPTTGRPPSRPRRSRPARLGVGARARVGLGAGAGGARAAGACRRLRRWNAPRDPARARQRSPPARAGAIRRLQYAGLLARRGAGRAAHRLGLARRVGARALGRARPRNRRRR